MYKDTMKIIMAKTWRRLILAIKFFTAKRVMSDASALTYSTLLAIVPVMAVVFAVARGFGYSKYIETWFRDAFSSQPAVADTLIGFVNSYLIHTQSSIFLGVGLVVMLYTVLMLVMNIESVFNTIWNVKRQRSLFRTVTDYVAMLFLCPIAIVLMSGLSFFFANITALIPYVSVLTPTVKLLINLSPFVADVHRTIRVCAKHSREIVSLHSSRYTRWCGHANIAVCIYQFADLGVKL